MDFPAFLCRSKSWTRTLLSRNSKFLCNDQNWTVEHLICYSTSCCSFTASVYLFSSTFGLIHVSMLFFVSTCTGWVFLLKISNRLHISVPAINALELVLIYAPFATYIIFFSHNQIFIIILFLAVNYWFNISCLSHCDYLKVLLAYLHLSRSSSLFIFMTKMLSAWFERSLIKYERLFLPIRNSFHLIKFLKRLYLSVFCILKSVYNQ